MLTLYGWRVQTPREQLWHHKWVTPVRPAVPAVKQHVTYVLKPPKLCRILDVDLQTQGHHKFLLGYFWNRMGGSNL